MLDLRVPLKVPLQDGMKKNNIQQPNRLHVDGRVMSGLLIQMKHIPGAKDETNEADFSCFIAVDYNFS